MKKTVRNIGLYLLLLVWLGLAVLAWVKPAGDISTAERRPLHQMPQVNKDTLLSGSFAEDFESYATDQFPGRDLFRQIKALFHYNVAGRLDNNGIYVEDGYAAKLEYPLNTESVDHAISRFQWIHQKFLSGSNCKVYCAVVPDKGYYLAADNGYPAMDYSTLFSKMKNGLSFATYVDLTDCLAADDYYHTDTHWRQEKLIPAATRLCQAMGVTPPKAEDYSVTPLKQPFYGVYYGQAALPMAPDTLYLMQSDLLKNCTVKDYETGKNIPVYNLEKAEGGDPYEVYLSGPKTLLQISNPSAKTDRELIVFRDSFGSSMVPLLVQDYKTVTLVDIRYMDSWLLDRYLTFGDQDVLFLYSTLVLNNSSQLK